MQTFANKWAALSEYQLIHHYKVAQTSATEKEPTNDIKGPDYSQMAQSLIIQVSSLLMETPEKQPLKQACRLLRRVADNSSKDQAFDIKHAMTIVVQVDTTNEQLTNHERKAAQILQNALRQYCIKMNKETQTQAHTNEQQTKLWGMELAA